MKLSVIVPVLNEPRGLARLLLQLREMQIADQVIICDDGSDIPCSPALVADMSRRMGEVIPLDVHDPLPGSDLVWLRSDRSRGAGHARNRGAERAKGSHVLFFDADDVLTPEIGEILDDLAGRKFDFAMFRHHDSRVLKRGGTGPLEPDASYWAAAGIGERFETVSHEGALSLCRVAAYPWNKIWNRSFLRRESIHCTEIPVHNDVEHHWSGFLSARTILASRQVGCIHHVDAGRSQLTNRRGIDRLRVFEALDNVADRFVHAVGQDVQRADFADPFLEFMLRLLRWIRGQLDSATALSRLTAEQALFLRRLAAPSRAALAPAIELALLRNPTLARWAAPELERAA
ncbi:glycosyltransferase family 2 protein [Pseudoponticoccus marisrubri]|uniref:Glycosyltransferase 2-like domain-containing protein n=1 Tax=Pseudoponticoccus marisrubri TaxID=1685382 RepID=A0A0W7WE95_9RHOB|nr:glycosyltransferase [Pseudoponticoccus marisrubri]KUF08972.1 hypothetical protein AVJ23_19990 [Pseudoponticoccus marisrubri]